jgi:hypothetical protein
MQEEIRNRLILDQDLLRLVEEDSLLEETKFIIKFLNKI